MGCTSELSVTVRGELGGHAPRGHVAIPRVKKKRVKSNDIPFTFRRSQGSGYSRGFPLPWQGAVILPDGMWRSQKSLVLLSPVKKVTALSELCDFNY